MLLKLYDLNHTLIGGLKNHKDAKIESELSTGDKTLSFLWNSRNKLQISNEYYIRTDTDEFVVKENAKSSAGYRNIVAKLNLEDIESRIWKTFTASECNALEMAELALTDTGWTCVCTVPESKLRNITLTKVNSYQVFEKIKEAFWCEIQWDTIHKIVYLKEQIGTDKGAYFISGLNLREISDASDTYDFATEIIPFGADGLDITSVNDGKNFLTNYQYSAKKIPIIWEDSNYTDAQALKEDAEYRLNELSKPKKTRSAKVIDLAKLKPEYDILSYSVGDMVTLIDNESGIHEKQRIVKTVEYLESPEKNTCDISNTALSFEELQKKLFAAAECIGNITTDNGTVNGSRIDKVDISKIIGIEEYLAGDLKDLQADYIYARNELGAVYAAIGEADVTTANISVLNVKSRADVVQAQISQLNAKTAEIESAQIEIVEADNISASKVQAGIVEADNISALETKVKNIEAANVTTEYLEANYAKIDFANVNTAVIKQGFLENLMVSQGIISNRVVSPEVTVTNCLTGVNILANDIKAGKLDAAEIEVINLNAANITVGTINGQQIASGAIDINKLDKNLSGTIIQTEEDVLQALEKAGLATNVANAANGTANSAKNAVDNLQIGGRNLFKGYGEKEISLPVYQNTGSFKQFYDCLTFDPAEHVGEEFTISFYAKSPNGTTSLRIYNTNNSPRYFYFEKEVDSALGNEWKYYCYTFTNMDRGSSYTAINRLEIYASSKTGVLIKKIKVEKGNKATDWTSSPEDIDVAMAQVQQTAQTAQNTADGKNTVFYQTTAPATTDRKVNDIWFDTGNGNKMYCYNGSIWTQKQFGTGAIANASITNALIADAAIQNAKIANLDAAKLTSGYISADRIQAGTLTVSKLDSNTQANISNSQKRIKTTIDLSDGTYNENLYYPVVGTRISDDGYHTYEVNVQLNSSSKPSWSTHSLGFTVNFCAKVKGYGWGTATSKMGWIDDNSFNFCDKMPVFFQQLTCASLPVFYLRGGGEYYIYTDRPCTWSVKTATYTINEQSVEPKEKPTNWSYLQDNWANAETIRKNNSVIVTWCYANDTTYINGGKIYTGTITAIQIAASAITAEKIDALAVTAAKIAAGAITTDKLAANAVTAAKIAAGAIAATNIASNAITTEKLSAGAVTTAKLASDSVTADKIVAGTITTTEIAAGAITTDKLVANAVTAAKIAAGAITTDKLAANAITAAKIAAGTITADKINLNSLFAQNITATGTIEGLTLKGTNLTADILIAKKQGELSIFKFDSTGLRADLTGENTLDYYFTKNYFIASIYNSDNIKRAYFYMDTEDSVSTKGRAVIFGNEAVALKVGAGGRFLFSREDNGTSLAEIDTNGNFYENGKKLSEKYQEKTSSDGYVAHPYNASLVGTTNTSGYLRITLPVSWTNTMLKFKVSIFIYATGTSCDYYISGYTYAATSQWINCTAYCTGKYSAYADLPVSFGHDGSKCAVTIGTAQTSWTYAQISISDVTLGYSNYSYDVWKSGWSMGFFSSELSKKTTTVNDTHITRTTGAITSDGRIQPATDNVRYLGYSSNRWKTVYAGNATINTSDRNQKHDILYDLDSTQLENVFYGLKPVTYVMNNGERTHIGIIAQDAQETIEKYGYSLDDLAFLCRDQEYDILETDEGRKEILRFNEDGTPKYIYGVRYTELIGLNIWQTQKHEAKINEHHEQLLDLRKEIEMLRKDNAQLKQKIELLSV